MYFTLVNACEKDIDKKWKAWKHWKLHHDAICDVDMEGAQQDNFEFHQTLNRYIICFHMTPREEYFNKFIHIWDTASAASISRSIHLVAKKTKFLAPRMLCGCEPSMQSQAIAATGVVSVCGAGHSSRLAERPIDLICNSISQVTVPCSTWCLAAVNLTKE